MVLIQERLKSGRKSIKILRQTLVRCNSVGQCLSVSNLHVPDGLSAGSLPRFSRVTGIAAGSPSFSEKQAKLRLFVPRYLRAVYSVVQCTSEKPD